MPHLVDAHPIDVRMSATEPGARNRDPRRSSQADAHNYLSHWIDDHARPSRRDVQGRRTFIRADVAILGGQS